MAGITADVERLRRNAESSPAIVTALNPYIGYEAAAAIAHEALETGATIRDVVIERGHVASGEITEEQLDRALDVAGDGLAARSPGGRSPGGRSASGGTQLTASKQPAVPLAGKSITLIDLPGN